MKESSIKLKRKSEILPNIFQLHNSGFVLATYHLRCTSSPAMITHIRNENLNVF